MPQLRKRKSRRGQIQQYDGWWKQNFDDRFDYSGPMRCDYMTTFGLSPGDFTVEEKLSTSAANIQPGGFVYIVPQSFNVVIMGYVDFCSNVTGMKIRTDHGLTFLSPSEVQSCTFWTIVGVIKLPSGDCQEFLHRRLYRGKLSTTEWRKQIDIFFDDDLRRTRLNPPVQILQAEKAMQMPVIQTKGRLVHWPEEALSMRKDEHELSR